MTTKIAYCAILRISFVNEYVYILLVFYDIGFMHIVYFEPPDRFTNGLSKDFMVFQS